MIKQAKLKHLHCTEGLTVNNVFLSLWIILCTPLVLKNMYDTAKSFIKKDKLWSHYVLCNVVVRQGDNLSPLLFALFINDFWNYISQRYKGLNISRTCYPSLSSEYLVFFKI